MELKPCPFCGHEARIIEDVCGHAWVACTYCECKLGYYWSKGHDQGEFGAPDEAAAEWNTRSEAK